MKRQVIFWAGFSGAFLFILASILGGLQIEGYSFISQFISESYATGIPNSDYLRMLFVTSGVLLAIFGFTTAAIIKNSNGLKISFVLFAILYGLGTVSTGFFPCDFGCPAEGDISLSQFIHNTSGFFVYAFVPFCLIGISLTSKKHDDMSKLSKVSLICGVLSLVFVVLLFCDPTGPYIGLIQRIIEGSILFWVVVTALHIQRTNNQSV